MTRDDLLDYSKDELIGVVLMLDRKMARMVKSSMEHRIGHICERIKRL